MLTLSAEVPMFYMCPATFQGSQTASHQVRGSASAMQSYSHCLSPSKNGCNVGKHSQASIWDSPRNQALQVQGFQTHTPGKAEVWAQEMTPPTEDEHHTAGCSYDSKTGTKISLLKMHGPRSSPQIHLLTSFTECVLPWNKTQNSSGRSLCNVSGQFLSQYGTFSSLQPEDDYTIWR